MSNELSTTKKGEWQQTTLKLAERYSVTPGMLHRTIQDTVFSKSMKRQATHAEFITFCAIANEHRLNPMTGEITAFPKKGGGVQVVIPVDGWITIINSHPQMDGVEFDDHFSEDGVKIESITCRIYRKDRSRPTVVTEYLDECFDNSKDTWRRWPKRMLRHKALIQCARVAFGLAGMIDPDERDRLEMVGAIETTATRVAIDDDVFDDDDNTSDAVDDTEHESGNDPESVSDIEGQLSDPQVTSGEENQELQQQRPIEEHEPRQTSYGRLVNMVSNATDVDDLNVASDESQIAFANGEIDEDEKRTIGAAIVRKRDELNEA